MTSKEIQNILLTSQNPYKELEELSKKELKDNNWFWGKCCLLIIVIFIGYVIKIKGL